MNPYGMLRLGPVNQLGLCSLQVALCLALPCLACALFVVSVSTLLFPKFGYRHIGDITTNAAAERTNIPLRTLN